MDSLRDFVSILQLWWANPLRAVVGLIALPALLWSIWPMVKRSDAQPPPPAGDSITIHGDIKAPSQIGGRGNVLNVNLPAYFEKAVVDRPESDPRRARLRIIATRGRSWGAGITPRFEIGLNRPSSEWDVDLAPWQPEVAPGVRAGSIRNFTRYERQQDGVYYIGFSIGDPPQPGEDVVFTIACKEPFEVVSVTAKPSGP
jgi:hypothetical protein